MMKFDGFPGEKTILSYKLANGVGWLTTHRLGPRRRQEERHKKQILLKHTETEMIAGIIFPILPEFVDRLLVENRFVFVKYLPHNGIKVVPKSKLLFYVSHSSKEIVGEGRIEEILFLTPNEVVEKYGTKVFLDWDELIQYVHKQPKRESSKEMLVLVLSRLKRYNHPVKYKKPISMAGQYLSETDYSELLKCVNNMP